MKSKTIWFICLALILYGGFLMDTFNQIMGTIILGLSSYLAGAYHIKWKLEKENNEYDKLL